MSYDEIIWLSRNHQTVSTTRLAIQQIFRKNTNYFWCYFVNFFAHQAGILIQKSSLQNVCKLVNVHDSFLCDLESPKVKGHIFRIFSDFETNYHIFVYFTFTLGTIVLRTKSMVIGPKIEKIFLHFSTFQDPLIPKTPQKFFL